MRLFDLPSLPCDDIGRVLVNEMLAWQHEGAPPPANQVRQACLDRLQLLACQGRADQVG